MPTFALLLQGRGYWRGRDEVVGATFGYQALSDSSGGTHDGDDSYIILPPLSTPSGRVSWPIGLQAYGLTPGSITLRVVARREAGSAPDLQIGFSKGTVDVAFHASAFVTSGSYVEATRTFTTNPLTAAAWTAEDLVGLEACVQSKAPALGRNFITLVNGSIDYLARSNWTFAEPRANVLA